MELERYHYIAKLLDVYHPLLTDKQADIALATFKKDLSLSEIASALSITRSAVQDHLHKSIAKLEEAEKALGFLAIFESQEKWIEALENTPLSEEQKHLLQSLKDVI